MKNEKNCEITMPELPTSASVRFGVSMLAAEELAREGFFLRLRFLTRLKEFVEICEIVEYENSTSADSQLGSFKVPLLSSK